MFYTRIGHKHEPYIVEAVSVQQFHDPCTRSPKPLLQRAGANTGQTAEKHGVPAPGSKIVFLNQSAELVGATQRLCHISRE